MDGLVGNHLITNDERKMVVSALGRLEAMLYWRDDVAIIPRWVSDELDWHVNAGRLTDEEAAEIWREWLAAMAGRGDPGAWDADSGAPVTEPLAKLKVAQRSAARDFRLYWAGQLVSNLGSTVSILAVPLLAVLVFHVSTLQVGLLEFVEGLGTFFVSLPAGVFLRRVRKRPVMIWAGIGLMASVAWVPIAHALGILSLGQLYAEEAFSGALIALLTNATTSHLQTLAAPGAAQLRNAQTKLERSRSGVNLVGPQLASSVIGVMGFAGMLVDAFSDLVAAGSLILIRGREPEPKLDDQPTPITRSLVAGLRYTLGHPIIRATTLNAGVWNFWLSGWAALRPVFLLMALGASQTQFAGQSTFVGVGSILGILLGNRLVRLVGAARAVWLIAPLISTFTLVLPFARPGVGGLVIVGIGMVAIALAATVYRVAGNPYAQTEPPAEKRDEVTAARQWLAWAFNSVGALLGGALGTWLGVYPAVAIVALGVVSSGLVVMFSPLWGAREFHNAEETMVDNAVGRLFRRLRVVALPASAPRVARRIGDHTLGGRFALTANHEVVFDRRALEIHEVAVRAGSLDLVSLGPDGLGSLRRFEARAHVYAGASPRKAARAANISRGELRELLDAPLEDQRADLVNVLGGALDRLKKANTFTWPLDKRKARVTRLLPMVNRLRGELDAADTRPDRETLATLTTQVAQAVAVLDALITTAAPTRGHAGALRDREPGEARAVEVESGLFGRIRAAARWVRAGVVRLRRWLVQILLLPRFRDMPDRPLLTQRPPAPSNPQPVSEPEGGPSARLAWFTVPPALVLAAPLVSPLADPTSATVPHLLTSAAAVAAITVVTVLAVRAMIGGKTANAPPAAQPPAAAFAGTPQDTQRRITRNDLQPADARQIPPSSSTNTPRTAPEPHQRTRWPGQIAATALDLAGITVVGLLAHAIAGTGHAPLLTPPLGMIVFPWPRAWAKQLIGRLASRLPQRDYGIYLVGRTVSQVGSEASRQLLALAAAALNASPFQMGLLKLASTLPNLFSLLAGPLAERVQPRRRAMLWLDLASAVVVGSIPLLHMLGINSFWQLLAVALLGSALGVLHTVISRSYLKSLVGEDRIVEANTHLQALDWVTRILGPAVAGALLGFLPPAPAITIDFLSFLLSAGALKFIRTRETPPDPAKNTRDPAEKEQKRKGALTGGVKFAFAEPILHVMFTTVIPGNIAFVALDTNRIIFLVDTLHASRPTIGLIGTITAIGGLAGLMTGRWLGRRFGDARVMWISMVFPGALTLLTPLGQSWWGLVLATIGLAAANFGSNIFNAVSRPYQTLKAEQADNEGAVSRERVYAAYHFLSQGPSVLGGPLGGLLGGWLGPPTVILLMALVYWVSSWRMLFSTLFGSITLAEAEEKARAKDARRGHRRTRSADRAAVVDGWARNTSGPPGVGEAAWLNVWRVLSWIQLDATAAARYGPAGLSVDEVMNLLGQDQPTPTDPASEDSENTEAAKRGVPAGAPAWLNTLLRYLAGQHLDRAQLAAHLTQLTRHELLVNEQIDGVEHYRLPGGELGQLLARAPPGAVAALLADPVSTTGTALHQLSHTRQAETILDWLRETVSAEGNPGGAGGGGGSLLGIPYRQVRAVLGDTQHGRPQRRLWRRVRVGALLVLLAQPVLLLTTTQAAGPHIDLAGAAVVTTVAGLDWLRWVALGVVAVVSFGIARGWWRVLGVGGGARVVFAAAAAAGAVAELFGVFPGGALGELGRGVGDGLVGYAFLAVMAAAEIDRRHTKRTSLDMSLAPKRSWLAELIDNGRRVCNSSALSLLSNKNFTRLLFVNAISSIGTGMQTGSLTQLALQLSNGSQITAGSVYTVMYLPPLLFSLGIGSIIDILSRGRGQRRWLQATHLGLAITSFMLSLSTHIGLWWVYAWAFIDAAFNAATLPSRQVFLRELLGEKASRAGGLNNIISNLGGFIVGPTLATLLIPYTGFTTMLVFDAASFAVVALGLFWIKPAGLPTPAAEGDTPDKTTRQRPVEALRYLRGKRELTIMIITIILVTALGLNNANLALSLLAYRGLGGGMSTLRDLVVAAGTGGITGALWMTLRPQDNPRWVRATAVVYGLLQAATGFMPNVAAAFAAQLLASFTVQLLAISMNNYQLKSVEHGMYARVAGLITTLTTIVTMIGSAALGWAGEQWGGRTPAIADGILTTLAALSATVALHRLGAVRLPAKRRINPAAGRLARAWSGARPPALQLDVVSPGGGRE